MQGNLEKARSCALTSLRLDPMDAEARVLMDSIERAREKLNTSKTPPQSPPAAAVANTPTTGNGMAKSGESAGEGTGIGVEARRRAGEEKKNAGNEAMKANDYPLAIQLYSEAIELDPTNMMFYNNRAQAFLKVSRFAEAELDSTLVVDSNKRLPNLKALFRRALARKGINTARSLSAALEDLSAILKAEPANKEAAKEKGRVTAMLAKAEAEELAATERVVCASAATKAPATADRGLGDDMVARSTRVKTPVKPIDSSDIASDKTPPSAASASTPVTGGSAAANLTPSSGSKRASPAVKRVVVQNPIVPSEPPKTVYELERVWRGLKNRPELFADYLRTFKKSTFKKVVKEAVSSDLVSSMLVSVRDHLIRTDTATAFNVLEGLSNTPNFGMTVSLLPAADIECVSACIDHLTTHVDRSRGEALRLAYNI